MRSSWEKGNQTLSREGNEAGIENLGESLLELLGEKHGRFPPVQSRRTRAQLSPRNYELHGKVGSARL